MMDWKNKKAAVLGLGMEGISSVKFLVKSGARVTVLDKKNEEYLISLLRHSGKPRQPTGRIQNLSGRKVTAVRDSGVSVSWRIPRMTGFERMPEIVGGEDYLKNLSDFDVIIRSPGVKRNLPEIITAEKSGVEITSQTNIFFDHCPCPIIGVTGTKGKSTTSTLIYEMLKKQGFDAYLGGNIGRSPLEFLDKLNDRSLVVLELSSYQLQDIKKSPHIAVVLMILQEHLDYHETQEKYIDAKRNILRFQNPDDIAVVNRDYPASHESDVLTSAKVFQVSREGEVKEGCFVKNGKIVLQMSFPRKRESGFPIKSGMTQTEIIHIKDILLLGKHNLENVCAAVMAAWICGVSKENIANVLKNFSGLAHRLEFVAEKNGISFYNDSLSTIPQATIQAIEALPETETLIVGGFDRGIDLMPLVEYLAQTNIKTLILFPTTGEKIWQSLCKLMPEKYMEKFDVKTMEQAVRIAASETSQGKICLLSPAAASFGIFKDYKDRGEQFKREVLKLKS